jgi:hypothetical protein
MVNERCEDRGEGYGKYRDLHQAFCELGSMKIESPVSGLLPPVFDL